MSVWFWLILVVVFLVTEIMTVGLTSIWFAGGALAGFLVALCGLGLIWQVVIAIVVTIVLLVVTRPLAMKYLNTSKEKTNLDDLIGKHVQITEKVDNIAGTGRAILNGHDWAARAQEDSLIISSGSFAQVIEIQGVKLIVKEIVEGV